MYLTSVKVGPNRRVAHEFWLRFVDGTYWVCTLVGVRSEDEVFCQGGMWASSLWNTSGRDTIGDRREAVP